MRERISDLITQVIGRSEGMRKGKQEWKREEGIKNNLTYGLIDRLTYGWVDGWMYEWM